MTTNFSSGSLSLHSFDLFDDETLSLTLTNVVLGIVTVGIVVLVVGRFAHDLYRRHWARAKSPCEIDEQGVIVTRYQHGE